MPPDTATADHFRLRRPPRHRRDTANELHLLADILSIATCAIIDGAEPWGAITEYGRTKEAFFRRFLRHDHGIPSPDNLKRSFAKLAPTAFARAFVRWMTAACVATGLVPVAIDGKSARAAWRGKATGCPHMVTEWAAEDRLALGAAAVPDGSDEVATIPVHLRTLDLAGVIITIDAAGCQVENARIICKQEAGGTLPAGRRGQPADAAGGRRGGVRAGLRGGFRRRPVRRPRDDRGRPRAARGAACDGRLSDFGSPARLAGRGGGGPGEPGAGGGRGAWGDPYART